MNADDIRLQHKAVAYHREQARLHAVLVGKVLLEIKRSGRDAWKTFRESSPIPAHDIRNYIQQAQQFEEAAARVR